MKTLTTALIALAAAALLVACGGGGGNDDQAPAEDPTKAPANITGSTAAWFKFASGLAPVDMQTPLAMDAITSAPQSESEEPQPL
jgi:hypothetical protein